MISLSPDKSVTVIKARAGRVPLLIVQPKEKQENAPGVLWIHGGGYFLGMKEMIYMGRAIDLVKKFGATVISPGYRLAFQAPYPAAIEDCYSALLYLKDHADELGIRKDQLMVGGESAGGGLTAALCIMARDRGEVNIAYQMPLFGSNSWAYTRLGHIRDKSPEEMAELLGNGDVTISLYTEFTE